MKADEARELLQELAKSLRTNPNQFTFAVNLTVENITGLHSVASAPGAIGTSVVMGAGASGTGMHITAGITDADISIAQGIADEASKAQMLSAAAEIERIAEEVAKEPPNHNRIAEVVAALSKLAVPGIVLAVVQAILRLALPG